MSVIDMLLVAGHFAVLDEPTNRSPSGIPRRCRSLRSSSDDSHLPATWRCPMAPRSMAVIALLELFELFSAPRQTLI
jgi:hypothetical protein